mgnify:FL=1
MSENNYKKAVKEVCKFDWNGRILKYEYKFAILKTYLSQTKVCFFK